MKPQRSPQSLTPLSFLPIVQSERGEAAIKFEIAPPGVPTLRAGPQFRNPKHETNLEQQMWDVRYVTYNSGIAN